MITNLDGLFDLAAADLAIPPPLVVGGGSKPAATSKQIWVVATFENTGSGKSGAGFLGLTPGFGYSLTLNYSPPTEGRN